MEPIQTQNNSNARNFFINISATISLYVVVGSLLNLLFTIINKAYPQVDSYYYTVSMSWPVSLLVVFAPLFFWLSAVMARNIDGLQSNVHKWLTYLTLFVAGAFLVGSLVTTFYLFIDGQELTSGFLLKVLSIVLVSGGVFAYYIQDVTMRLNPRKRLYWRIFAITLIILSILWGFVEIGSPRTQRMYRYDEQKVTNLSSISSYIQGYYNSQSRLPESLEEMVANIGYVNTVDTQTGEKYEYYVHSENSYSICAVFNKDSIDRVGYRNVYYYSDTDIHNHKQGRQCFTRVVEKY